MESASKDASQPICARNVDFNGTEASEPEAQQS